MPSRGALLAIVAVACLGAVRAGAQALPATPLPALTSGPLQLSGLLDVYSAWNGNHPAGGANQLAAFDTRADQFTLNLFEADLALHAAPFGFELDAAGGEIPTLLAATEPTNPLRHLLQAFATYTSKPLDGIEFDLGKFATSAGVESPEAVNEWNYSRSLLFAWAQPNYHFGLRTTIPAGANLTLGFQVVNGWNRTFDGNGFRTLAATGVYTHGGLMWYQDFYSGPEEVGGGVPGSGARRLYDATWIEAARPWLKLALNVDAGWQVRPLAASARWDGAALGARLLPGHGLAFSPRWEYYADPQGYTTGAAQHLTEWTLTGDWQTRRWAMLRAELRQDRSDQPTFERGDGGRATRQTVGVVNLLVYFGAWGK